MTTSRLHPLPQGTSLARGAYTVETVLGQGGFGYVYLARDRQGQTCAVKQCTDLSSEGLMQFGHEVAVQKILDDGTFVRVFTQFVEKVPSTNPQAAVESLFTVMEYIPGESLEEILAARLQRHRGPFPEQDAVGWIAQVLGALHNAHEVGIIHRDIKPSNLLLMPDGTRVKIIDLGIAKIGGLGSHTLQGARGVSPGYSPPEQYAQTGQTDTYSDIYAVGATLYHLVTGYAPVDAPVRQSGQPLIRPRQHNPALSSLVEDVILQAMQLDVADRFQGAREMLAALQGKTVLSAARLCGICHGPLNTGTQFCPHCGSAVSTLKLATATVQRVADLPEACYANWQAAVDGLTTGQLEQWLQGQAAQGQQLLLAIREVRAIQPQDPNLQLDTLLRQINPALPAARLQARSLPHALLNLEVGTSHSTRLDITNAGLGYLIGSVASTEAWVRLTPATVFCAPGQTQHCNVTFDTTGLVGEPAGRRYTARVTVQTNGGSQALMYPLVVTAIPCLRVAPDWVDWGTIGFRQPPARLLHVANTGTGCLPISFHAPVPWLRVTPAALTLGPQEEQQVAVEVAPHLIEARGQQGAAVQVVPAGANPQQVRVMVNLAGPVVLSAAPREKLVSLADLVRWCDRHWLDAVRMLRSGELVAAIEYLAKPARGAHRQHSAGVPAIVLDKIRQASVLPNENLALETILRALGARPPRMSHNWRAIERKLGMGWRPDLRWLWPWWSGPGLLTFVVENRERGYLHGRVDPAVPWLEVRQPEFGCLVGQQQRIGIGLRKHQRRLRGLAPEILILRIN